MNTYASACTESFQPFKKQNKHTEHEDKKGRRKSERSYKQARDLKRNSEWEMV